MVQDYSSIRGNTENISLPPAAQLFEGLEIGFFSIEGKDAGDFLHRQLSNEIRNLPVNSGVPVCLLNREGRILLYFTLWKTESGYSAVVPERQRGQFIPLLERVIFREEIRLMDQTPESFSAVLAGAHSIEMIQKIETTQVPDKLLQSTSMSFEGVFLRVYRMDWLAYPCFLLVCPVAESARLKEGLKNLSATDSSLDLFHSYRVEKGSPWPGYEVDETVIPFECGLEHTASLTKGCYVGQEMIARIHNLGKPARVLRGLVLEGETPPERGTPVCSGKVEVGKILYATWSNTLKRLIATTSIRIKYSTEGTLVTVGEIPGAVRVFPLVR